MAFRCSAGNMLGSLEAAGHAEESGDLLRYLADSDEHWPSQILEAERT